MNSYYVVGYTKKALSLFVMIPHQPWLTQVLVLVSVVPAGDKAVPASPGSPVPHQHLLGGRHSHVVPVE